VNRRAKGDGGLSWDVARERCVASATIGYDGRGRRIARRGSGEDQDGGRLSTARPPPDDPPKPGPHERQSRVSGANPQDTSAASALDGRTEGPTLPHRGRPSPHHQLTRPYVDNSERTIMGTLKDRPPVAPVLYRVDEAAEALRLSRSVLYELIRSGGLRTVKAGRRRLVPVAALTEYVASLDAA
jgi:excisionase family DNA binding protein